MRHNRGLILAEETLKIIIAVIAIGFLVYLLTSIYFSAQKSKELEQAKETLPHIIQEAKDGEASVEVYNPKDWWILSVGEEICICKENDYAQCKGTEGICESSDFSMLGSVKIENPPITLNINQQTKTFSERK